jgi:hypothetical protein
LDEALTQLLEVGVEAAGHRHFNPVIQRSMDAGLAVEGEQPSRGAGELVQVPLQRSRADGDGDSRLRRHHCLRGRHRWLLSRLR